MKYGEIRLVRCWKPLPGAGDRIFGGGVEGQVDPASGGFVDGLVSIALGVTIVALVGLTTTAWLEAVRRRSVPGRTTAEP